MSTHSDLVKIFNTDKNVLLLIWMFDCFIQKSTNRLIFLARTSRLVSVSFFETGNVEIFIQASYTVLSVEHKGIALAYEFGVAIIICASLRTIDTCSCI